VSEVGIFYPDSFADFIVMLNESGCLHLEGGMGGAGCGMGYYGEHGQPGAVNTTLPWQGRRGRLSGGGM